VYLLDTNLILELLLEQERADEVAQLLGGTPSVPLYLSEFALYSIGIILFRLQKHQVFGRFVDDLVLGGRVQLVRVSASEMPKVTRISQEFGLDFDDAYQYVAAEKHDLQLVSFDRDFDGTMRGRQTPREVLPNL
jgi:predicted nucleic acid-binding protein